MIPSQASSQEVLTAFVGSPRLNAYNRASGRNYVTWLLLFCIFAFLVRQTLLLRGRTLSYALSAVDTFAALDIAVVFLTAAVLIFTGSLVRLGSAFRRTPVVWYYWYYMFCALSFLWSNFPIYSLYRALEYIILLSATLAAVEQFQDFAGAEQAFLRVGMATILLVICINLRLFGFSLSLEAWHTNSYSACAAMLFCYCLGEYLAMTKTERSEYKGRSGRLLRFGIFSFGALMLGTSVTSNLAAVVGCLLILLVLRRIGLMLIMLFLGLLIFLYGVGGHLVHNIVFEGRSEGEIASATGRTFFWEYLWLKFLKSPVLGYGFGILTGGHDRILASSPHNSFFSVIIGTGLTGLAFFGLFAIRLWWITIGRVWSRGTGTVGFTGALAAAFVNSLGYPMITDRWEPAGIIFVWLLGLFLLHVRGTGHVVGAV